MVEFLRVQTFLRAPFNYSRIFLESQAGKPSTGTRGCSFTFILAEDIITESLQRDELWHGFNLQ